MLIDRNYQTFHARVFVISRPSYVLVDSQARNDRGNSALALASDFGRAQVVRLLIVAGSEIESRDHRGFPSLIHAAREVKQVFFALLYHYQQEGAGNVSSAEFLRKR